jgi:nitrous oxidase accessory protein
VSAAAPDPPWVAPARRPSGLLLVAAALLALAPARAGEPHGSLQPLVDATPAGGELRPPPGTYAGGVVIRAPIRLDGGGRVTIDAGGRGTVLRVETDGAEIRGLRLVGSGTNHDTVDAGIKLLGHGNVIQDNSVEDCLFGIDLAESNRNVVRGNSIHSKSIAMGLRGDAIRLWYSFQNAVLENQITDSRDVVVWYSRDNVIARNRVRHGRYALHTMYAGENLIEQNDYRDNMVGVFLMYSDGVVVRGNRIHGAQGPTGMGIGMKETTRAVIEDNVVVYSATGLYLDLSPYEPDETNRVERNRLAYNGIGVLFHSDWSGNEFRENEFTGNFTQVAVRGGGSASRHLWEGNYWDDYQGFDRDGNDVGDTPYELRAYADRIWMDVPPAAFFRASPLLEVIDFLDRLAPFSEPTVVLRDAQPRFAAPRHGPDAG